LKHQHFGFSGILLDPGGTGNQINDELILTKQCINGVDTTVIPIASHADMERTGPNAQFILTVFRPHDVGIEHLWVGVGHQDNLNHAMHNVMQEAICYQRLAFPKPFNSRPGVETADWPEEKRWALIQLDRARDQLVDIQVATTGTGEFEMTGHGALKFSSAKKKDMAYACIYAFVRFLVWLNMGELDYSDNEETDGYYVMSG
jgi:hypothetical protein